MITEINIPDAFSDDVENCGVVHIGDLGRYLNAAGKLAIKMEYCRLEKGKTEIRLEKGANRKQFLRELNERL